MSSDETLTQPVVPVPPPNPVEPAIPMSGTPGVPPPLTGVPTGLAMMATTLSGAPLVAFRQSVNIPYQLASLPINYSFTGQHKCITTNTALFTDTSIGLIVSATGRINNIVRQYDYDISSTITGTNATPVVDLASTYKDPKVLGVIGDYERQIGSRQVGDQMWACEYKDRRLCVNSTGEGAIWVSDKDGSITNGDLITTSVIPGVGTKQDDDIVHSYTVAKATMDCTFDPATVTLMKRIPTDTYNPERYMMNNNYKVDDFGNYIIEPSERTQPAYLVCYFNGTTNELIFKEDYDLKKLTNEPAYRAALISCTYS
jgi:hypothetical protein